MIELGVNIDHVATVRQARLTDEAGIRRFKPLTQAGSSLKLSIGQFLNGPRFRPAHR